MTEEDVAAMVHELRTPLAAILGFSELLSTRDVPEDERREYIDTIHEQAIRLSGMLDAVLADASVAERHSA